MTDGHSERPPAAIRLLGALVPGLCVTVADGRWLPSCWGSESPLCIWFWQPPLLDVLFALLVLVPMIPPARHRPLRVAAVVLASILVHWLAAELVVCGRGTLVLPGLDTLFLNVLPVAALASLALGATVRWVAGFKVRPGYFWYCGLAGLPPSVTFLLADLSDVIRECLLMDDLFHLWTWTPWHLALCAAILYGRPAAPL